MDINLNLKKNGALKNDFGEHEHSKNEHTRSEKMLYGPLIEEDMASNNQKLSQT